MKSVLMLPYLNYSLVEEVIHSLVFMLQNIFPEESQSRTISINAQYQVLFRNPRDSSQISILARQPCPLNSKSFLEIYKSELTSHIELMVIYFVVSHNPLLYKRFTE